MRSIVRINLYTSVKNMLSESSDLFQYIPKVINENFKNTLSSLLQMNIDVLMDIEDKFVINSNLNEIDKEKFKKIYTENLNKFKHDDYFINNEDIINNEEIMKLDHFADNFNELKDEFYAFNALIKLLNEINSGIINKFFGNDYFFEELNKYDISDKNKVFLSHAYSDKLYTLSLFIFMLNKGIFLYVDWMFSPNLGNGSIIKSNLSKHLLDSNQLLFLRTINSELSIRGSGNIRGWCSWELGVFYSFHGNRSNDKYYIELYRRKDSLSINKQLDGIKPLKNIISGRLV